MHSKETGHLPVLTQSCLKTLQTCHRKYFHRYEQGYKPVKESDALTFGSAVHEALEAWWKWVPGMGVSRMQWALDALPDTLEPFARARAEAMIAAYHAKWEDWVTVYVRQVLGVELGFRVPLRNPATKKRSRTFDLSGKIDVLVELTDGRIALIEHKTSGEDISSGSAYRARLLMDAQVSTYFLAAEAMGKPADVCIFDVLVKPKQRPLEANTRRDHAEEPHEYRDRCIDAISTAPDSYLAHIEVVRIGNEQEDFAADVWDLANMILVARNSHRWPRNPNACWAYSRPCEYLPVCLGQTSIETSPDFKKGPIHPELEETP